MGNKIKDSTPKSEKLSDSKNENEQPISKVSSSASIVARAGQIMAVIITLGVIGMIASMLVSESLGGDAAQINNAGALRMQAIRISRAIISVENESNQSNNKSSANLNKSKALVKNEINNFDERITHLFLGGITSRDKNSQIEKQYHLILSSWKSLKTQITDPIGTQNSIKSFDNFVTEIDQLVTFLQLGSEKKLASLRSIQGASLFTLLLIAFVVLYRLNRAIVIPLKQLVTVAEHAGKGDFSIKANYKANNELGLLASTINRMSEELALTYQDFEQRVDSKTKALTHSNRSLQVLYQAARKLASNDLQQTDEQIINELEEALGIGKITIERCVSEEAVFDKNNTNESLINNQLKQLKYPLEKPNQQYGCIIWHIKRDEIIYKWQTQMLRAMADIVATAIDLEQRRNSENRLLIVEERAVIARELHDSLAQSLSYLKVQTSLLTRKMQKNSNQASIEETIGELKHGLNAAYQQLRELLTTFRLKLDDPSLINALQGTVVEFSEKCQHKISLEFLIPENSLSANQEIHVLQIVREALSNVHRHAKASKAGVSLRNNREKLVVEIWDDGIGIDKIPQKQGHFGLGIMQERAKSLMSEISIEPRNPKGTRVSFEF